MKALTTCAALCTVEVSSHLLSTDLVLHLILQLVQIQQPHQVTVRIIPKEQNVLRMILKGCPTSTSSIQQRNTIVRCLVGTALHNAMDQPRSGCLAGGQQSLCLYHTSFQASVNAAQLNQWMSMAEKLRSNHHTHELSHGMKGDADSDDLEWYALNHVLMHSAYVLTYAAVPSLADLDLAVAILQQNNAAVNMEQYPIAIQRWLMQMSITLQELAQKTDISLEGKVWLPKTLPPTQHLFFCGTHDEMIHADSLFDNLYQNTTGIDMNALSHPLVGATDKIQKSQQSQSGETVVLSKKNGKLTKQEKNQLVKVQKGKGETNTSGGADKQQAATTYDITALDIRVGKIVKVWPHESAEKLFCEEIDLGNGEIRQIASGLRPFYQQEDLQDRLVLVLCNLKSRNLVGFPSHGMVLCASNADHTMVEFVVPPEGSMLGERVVFEGMAENNPPEPDSKVAKKKIFEQLAPDLKTNVDGVVVWKTHTACTNAGVISALNRMPDASVS